MNVKGFHGFVMGEGVCVVDPEGFSLEFQGLPPGKYTLTTYHHAPRSNTDSMDPNRERLKKLDIQDIPVAETISIHAGISHATAKTSAGKVLPQAGPGTATIEFEVEDDKPVRANFRDANSKRGIWIHRFELKQAI